MINFSYWWHLFVCFIPCFVLNEFYVNPVDLIDSSDYLHISRNSMVKVKEALHSKGSMPPCLGQVLNKICFIFLIGMQFVLILLSFPTDCYPFYQPGKGFLHPKMRLLTKMVILKSVMPPQLLVQPFRVLQGQKGLWQLNILTKMHRLCRMALANQVIVLTACWRVLALVLQNVSA